MLFEFHSNFICCICWWTCRRSLSASKILQSEGSLANNWQRLLFSSPRWLTDGARLSENSVGQGCSLRPSTCMMRITGSSNQPPKPGFVDDVTTFSNLKNLPFFFYESQPGSWLVAICERSENRGSGGGGSCQIGQKSGK